MARTPVGGFQGVLQKNTAALQAARTRASIGNGEVSEVLMGNVLSAGVGQAPARQAALGAGMELATPCTTISKVCGSGMKAVMLGHDLIAAGSADIIAAGGHGKHVQRTLSVAAHARRRAPWACPGPGPHVL
jgi:acetyl-CoA C-acetyltransferase